MIYELAVYICREIQPAEGVRFTEDEISFVAMHIGAYLEVQAARSARLRTVVVCPAYHEMATGLRERLEREFDQHLDTTGLVTRLDGVDDIDADLVISTVPLSGQDAPVVVVNVFPTWKDIQSVQAAITRTTRNRDRASAPHRLLDFLRPELFARNLDADGEEEAIHRLGALLLEADAIDETYLESVLEREALSSTAFTDGFAVPHVTSMSAQRSAIALAVNDKPVLWGRPPG
ncbi:BglG family transcription antiterminator [Streptomyces sp. NPDC058424]|uniref:BglG family transcription antiterminator n=1 Tax=Streptomyces sp. NPDC058424 TaxID=3346491 RepID=UPI00364C0F0F